MIDIVELLEDYVRLLEAGGRRKNKYRKQDNDRSRRRNQAAQEKS